MYELYHGLNSKNTIHNIMYELYHGLNSVYSLSFLYHIGSTQNNSNSQHVNTVYRVLDTFNFIISTGIE